MPYLLLQLWAGSGASLHVELSVTDAGGSKRRLVLSTAFRDVVPHALHAQLPAAMLVRSAWLNVCVDLEEVCRGAFGRGFEVLDGIAIGAACRVRNIIALRSRETAGAPARRPVFGVCACVCVGGEGIDSQLAQRASRPRYGSRTQRAPRGMTTRSPGCARAPLPCPVLPSPLRVRGFRMRICVCVRAPVSA